MMLFLAPNYIYTGRFAYCFWDTGRSEKGVSEIAVVTQQDPTKVRVIYSGSAGDHVLAVMPNGTIAFIPETTTSWFDLKSKGLYYIPGVPKTTDAEYRDERDRLKARRSEVDLAKKGLTRQYAFGRHKGAAKDLLYPGGLDSTSRMIFLEEPKQFMISWTKYKMSSTSRTRTSTWRTGFQRNSQTPKSLLGASGPVSQRTGLPLTSYGSSARSATTASPH